MATRHNLCPNPAVSVNITGFSGSPTRTALGGFPVSNVARYTSGSFLTTPRSLVGSITPAEQYTFSLYLQFTTFGGLSSSGTFYVGWYKSDGSTIQFDPFPYTSDINNVTRCNNTVTAPALASMADITIDGSDFASNKCDVSAIQYEKGSLGSYFDGDTANGSWDGVTGLSPSTLNEASSMANSISDTARVNMLTELTLSEPQLLSNVDLTRLVIAKVGQVLFPVTNKTVGGHYRDYLLVVRG